MSFEHGAHGVAQQRGVVARQRRHDQHRRLALELFQRGRIVGEALEAQQLAKRHVQLDALVNGDLDAVDLADAELGLLVILAQPVKQRVGGRHALRHRHLAQQRVPIAVKLGSSIRHVRERLQQGALRFVDLIEHERFGDEVLQCNITQRRSKSSGTNPLKRVRDTLATVREGRGIAWPHGYHAAP